VEKHTKTEEQEKRKKLATMKGADEIDEDDPSKSAVKIRESESETPVNSVEAEDARANREAARLAKMIGGGGFN